MSLLGLGRDWVNQQRQNTLKNDPGSREKIRIICREILNAGTAEEEYEKIVALQKLLPNT